MLENPVANSAVNVEPLEGDTLLALSGAYLSQKGAEKLGYCVPAKPPRGLRIRVKPRLQ
jgi:hypothetical protein